MEGTPCIALIATVSGRRRLCGAAWGLMSAKFCEGSRFEHGERRERRRSATRHRPSKAEDPRLGAIMDTVTITKE